MVKIKNIGKDSASWFDGELENKLLNFFFYGVPSSDKQGHSHTLNFKVRKIMTDIIQGYMEKAPKGWFKRGTQDNRSAFLRSVLLIGLEVMGIIMERKGIDLKELSNLLVKLNKLAYSERRDELDNDMKNLEQKIALSSLENKDKKIKTIRELTAEIKDKTRLR